MKNTSFSVAVAAFQVLNSHVAPGSRSNWTAQTAKWSDWGGVLYHHFLVPESRVLVFIMFCFLAGGRGGTLKTLIIYGFETRMNKLMG